MNRTLDNMPLAQQRTGFQRQWPDWGVVNWSEFPLNDPNVLEIWGYTGRHSYFPSDELTLHVHTTAKTFTVDIIRDGSVTDVVYHEDGLIGARQETSNDAYKTGCRWRPLHRFRIPLAWNSGGYVVILSATDGTNSIHQEAFFILKPGRGAPKAEILFVTALPTWIAYNDWGGGSHYYVRGGLGVEGEVDGYRFAPILSLERPWGRGLIRRPTTAPRVGVQREIPLVGEYLPADAGHSFNMAHGYAKLAGSAGWSSFDGIFARWIEQANYWIDYATPFDIHNDPTLLHGYNIVLQCGHDEYHTGEYRLALDHWLEQGGRVARFGGNIMWKVKLIGSDATGLQQVCYKLAHIDRDPLTLSEEEKSTGAYEWVAGINWPPASTWGVNGFRGCFVRIGGACPRHPGGFTVYRSDHWVFDGTDMYYGDCFGNEVPLIAYEVDGLSYTFRYGRVLPAGVQNVVFPALGGAVGEWVS